MLTAGMHTPGHDQSWDNPGSPLPPTCPQTAWPLPPCSGPWLSLSPHALALKTCIWPASAHPSHTTWQDSPGLFSSQVVLWGNWETTAVPRRLLPGFSAGAAEPHWPLPYALNSQYRLTAETQHRTACSPVPGMVRGTAEGEAAEALAPDGAPSLT